MLDKKPVYYGYCEQYISGLELKKLFKNKYYTTGKHHSDILGISITEYFYFIGINDSKIYRIFINEYFCRVMNGETDKFICFFGYSDIHILEHKTFNIKKIVRSVEENCDLLKGNMVNF